MVCNFSLKLNMAKKPYKIKDLAIKLYKALDPETGEQIKLAL